MTAAAKQKAKQGLRTVRDLFEKTHWIKGQMHMRYTDEQGKPKDTYCLVGGVRAVISGELDNPPGGPEWMADDQALAYRYAIQALGIRAAERRSYAVSDLAGEQLENIVIDYNDNSDTELYHVLSLLDEAFDAVDAIENPVPDPYSHANGNEF